MSFNVIIIIIIIIISSIITTLAASITKTQLVITPEAESPLTKTFALVNCC